MNPEYRATSEPYIFPGVLLHPQKRSDIQVDITQVRKLWSSAPLLLRNGQYFPLKISAFYKALS